MKREINIIMEVLKLGMFRAKKGECNVVRTSKTGFCPIVNYIIIIIIIKTYSIITNVFPHI